MKIKDNFWNNLKKYNPEQYVGESIDPLVVVSLFKLYESQESTSMESIAVTAFKLFPDKFSMTQFPEYPDYMRVFTAVRMHLKKYVEGDMKKNSFLLNGKGRIYAEEILERKRLEQQYGKEIHQHLTRTYRKTNPDQ